MGGWSDSGWRGGGFFFRHDAGRLAGIFANARPAWVAGFRVFASEDRLDGSAKNIDAMMGCRCGGERR